MNKYPKMGGIRNTFSGLCEICGEPKSTAIVDVEVNNFRGDDNTHKVHRACLKSKKSKEIMNQLGYK